MLNLFFFHSRCSRIHTSMMADTPGVSRRACPHNIIILKYYNISGAEAFLSPAPQRFPKRDTYSTAKRTYSTANKTYSTAKRTYSTANRWVLGSRASIEKNEVLPCSWNVFQLWVILTVSVS